MTDRVLEFIDADVVAEHHERHGDPPGRSPEVTSVVAAVTNLWRRNHHDRIEPAIAVNPRGLQPWRYTAYYTRAIPEVVLAFSGLVSGQRALLGQAWDLGRIERFVAHPAVIPGLQNAAIGLDAQPTLDSGRLKLGLGGRVAFPDEVTELLLDESDPGIVAALRARPQLRERLWGVNFDVGFDGSSATKLYFGYPASDSDDPFLRSLIGDLDWTAHSNVAFLQWARGQWLFHFSCDAQWVRRRVDRGAELIGDTGRRGYMVGAAAAELRGGAPLSTYNLYFFYRPAEPLPVGQLPGLRTVAGGAHA